MKRRLQISLARVLAGSVALGMLASPGNAGGKGKLSVPYTFTGKGDGGAPVASLITDAYGNFYGTTSVGGAYKYGAVFELAADGTETVLHSFDSNDGAAPVGALLEDSQGNFYGTTEFGGSIATLSPLACAGHSTLATLSA